MNKLLTIIIPTYNMEKYLRKCLDSLVISDDNMLKLEVLIINDGSKDSSSMIAHEYEVQYPHTFRVIDKINGNYGSCINRGINESKGKYVKVLDADDSFIKTSFDDFVDFLSTATADLIINDYCIVDESDTVKSEISFRMPIGRDFLVKELPSSTAKWLWHHGMTYRTKILTDMEYIQTEGISYTDDEWIFKPMIHVSSVCYFPHLLYKYLIGREGQTFDPQKLKKSLGDMLKVVSSMVDFYSSLNENEKRNDCYLYPKLLSRTIALYAMHINKYYSNEINIKLIDFDNDLKLKVPQLWDDLNNVSGKLKRRYIYNWRSNGYKKDKLLSLFLSVKSIINKTYLKKFLFYRMPHNMKRNN